MGYRSKLVRNSVYVGGFQVIHLVCNLLITPFIIHSVGLTKFGIWALFSSISSHLISLDMGMGASCVKFISEHYARKDFDHFNSVVNAGFIFNITLITPILLLALLFKDTIYSVFNLPVGIYDSLDLLFSGILLIVFITASTASYAAVLRATQRLKLASQIGALAILLKTVSIFLLLNAGLTRCPRPPQRTLQYACGDLGRAPCQVGAFGAS